MSVAVEVLEGISALTERLKKAQQTTEEMFISYDDGDDDMAQYSEENTKDTQ